MRLRTPFVFIASVYAAKVCTLTKASPTLEAIASAPSSSSLKAPDFVSSAWFAGWHANSGFAVSDISWDKYTHMTYAFAVTTPDVNALSITPDDEQIIPQFVSAAHAHNVSASISVGGWTGSRFFSTAVASAKNRTAFVNTLSNFVKKYNFDGLDFDWEYPNNQGIGCNAISSSDTANFLLLLQELRSTAATKNLILSAATAIKPFMDASGNPSSSVAGFAKTLDFIEIMNYDIWGSWSTAVGPNAPLDDSCAPAADQQGSATSAIADWTKAGMPAHQIVLGVGSYGHSFSVANSAAVSGGSLTAYPAFDASNTPTGDSWDDGAGVDVCGNQQGQGGNFDFWGLIQGGFLTTQGKAQSGINYRFDNCSKTAYVYNPATGVEVSFDDPPAFAAKGNFIASKKLRGFAMWEAGGDYKDILLDSILDGSGFATNESDLEFCDA